MVCDQSRTIADAVFHAVPLREELLFCFNFVYSLDAAGFRFGNNLVALNL